METLTRVVARHWDDADETLRDWAVARTPKEEASEWEPVDGYQVDCGDCMCMVTVLVGRASDVWFARTTDDGGGDDDFPDRPFASREEAVAAAEEFAAGRDETPDLDDLLAQVAEARGWDVATARRVAGEILSVPEHSGLRLDVFADGGTSLVTGNVYRYEPDVGFERYRGACSIEDAAMRLLDGADDV